LRKTPAAIRFWPERELISINFLAALLADVATFGVLKTMPTVVGSWFLAGSRCVHLAGLAGLVPSILATMVFNKVFKI